MQILGSIAELRQVEGSAHLAIGVFDGIHLGHQAVIGQAVNDAKASGGSSVVVTFHPHPDKVLRPENAPRLLTSAEHKIRLIRGLGVEWMLVIPFDEAFAATEAEDFVELLAASCRKLAGISVGEAWRFGRGARGNVDLLRRMGRELGFTVHGAASVDSGETGPVSSTRIRHAVATGNLNLAARLLGRPYTLLGTVRHGQALGRRLGFPTANLITHNEQFPPTGVYAVRARIYGAEEREARGVANLGYRPTVEDPAVRNLLLEVHFFDFDCDIYGHEVEVEFIRKIRDEMKFTGLDQLREQIAHDAQAARRLFEGER
jgi:riboflavin kinase/FMN adenylyltransferase